MDNDQDILLDGDIEQSTETENQQLEEAKPDAGLEEELKRLREENAKYQSLRPILEEVESDPSKIYNIRAALAGKQEHPQATVAPPAQASPEQLKAFNEQLTNAVLEGRGAEFITSMTQMQVSNALAQADREREPMVELQAETYLDGFKNRKERAIGNASLFTAYEKEFEKELADVNYKQLMAKSPGDRAKELERRWNAATGVVLQRKIKSAPAGAKSAAGGTSMGASRGPEPALNEKHRAILKRAGLADDEISRFDQELAQEGAY